jgi:hypothetical protein
LKNSSKVIPPGIAKPRKSIHYKRIKRLQVVNTYKTLVVDTPLYQTSDPLVLPELLDNSST